MKTEKPCKEKGCNGELDFNEEYAGRELTCKKCGAVYEYRNYMQAKAAGLPPMNFNPPAAVPEPKKQEVKEEEHMAKKDYGVCKKHGHKNVSEGKCWKCYKEDKAAGGGKKRVDARSAQVARNIFKGGFTAGVPSAGEGMVVPIRIELTVSVKVENK